MRRAGVRGLHTPNTTFGLKRQILNSSTPSISTCRAFLAKRILQIQIHATKYIVLDAMMLYLSILEVVSITGCSVLSKTRKLKSAFGCTHDDPDTLAWVTTTNSPDSIFTCFPHLKNYPEL